MPELPEVETIRRGLLPKVRGRTIADVVIGDRKVLKSPPERLAASLAGRSIVDLRRRGKNLIFDLGRQRLLFHLGMTGQLTFRDPGIEDGGFVRHPTTGLQRSRQHAPDKHTHLQIFFEDGTAVLFRDIRKFGKVVLFEADEDLLRHLQGLGMEPFSEDFVWKSFWKELSRRRVKVKSILLDQGFVAGVGNIYADEALFEARLHPERKTEGLSRAEAKRLFAAVPRVLQKGIVLGGTSLRDYVDSDGEKGSNQDELRVYGRAGEPCPRCGKTIVRIVVGQRGTHFCPRCQKKPG